MDGYGVVARQVRDPHQGSEARLGDAFGCRIPFEQGERPTGGDVIGHGGELGEGARQKVVKSIDGLGRLLDLGLQPAANVTEQNQGNRGSGRGLWSFDDSEASHGQALGVVVGAFWEVSLPIILVAFGLADGDDKGQIKAAEEQLEIGGILAGCVDPDTDLGLRMLLVQLAQALLQGPVALALFHDGEGWSGALEIGPEEGNAMAVTGCVDADTDAVEIQGADHDCAPEENEVGRPETRGVDRSVSLLRESRAK